MRQPIISRVASLLSIMMLWMHQASAEECSAKSGQHLVSLLELYTSEGCSSCPSADAWISRMSLSANQIVPLSFHVDYWDYIGWKDRFAQRKFSTRQRLIAMKQDEDTVYTPQFILNGKDFRGVNRLAGMVADNVKRPAQADLALSLSHRDNQLYLLATANLTHEEDNRINKVFIALYENKLSSVVKAGENSGRTLMHDYVVRELWEYDFASTGAFSKAMRLESVWGNGSNKGAAIFVQNERTGAVLQALQLPFCVVAND